MKKVLKSFLYIIACTAVFLILVEEYKTLSLKNLASSLEQKSAFEWERTVQIYVVDLEKARTSSCEAGAVLDRVIPNAETLIPGTIDMLTKGLTPDEAASGKYFSSINPKTMLRKFETRNKTAYVDFNSDLNKDVAGSCAVIAIRSQIENTIKNLPGIDSVVISVDGETEGILEP